MVSGLKTHFAKPFSIPATGAIFAGLLLVLLGIAGIFPAFPFSVFAAGFSLFLAGAGWFIFRRFYKNGGHGTHHFTWFQDLTSRGIFAWLLAIALTGFYAIIYWFPDWLNPLIRFADPLSLRLRGEPANQWFLYSAFYSMAVLIMGFRALL